MGGTKIRVTGSTEHVDAMAPRTMNPIMRNSNRVLGSRSSLLPTSAVNTTQLMQLETSC